MLNPILAHIAFSKMPVTVFILKSFNRLIPIQELYLPYSLSYIRMGLSTDRYFGTFLCL